MQLQRPHPVDLHAGSPRDLRSPRPVGGERDWQPRRLDARGSVLVATAFIRPDPDHAGFVSATLAPAGRYLQPDQRDFCYPTLAKSPA